MQIPVINLNGNTAQSLLEPLEQAYNALTIAIEKLKATSDVAHGRNYQTTDDVFGNSRKATEEHFDRIQRVHTVQQEIEKLMLGIQEVTLR